MQNLFLSKKLKKKINATSKNLELIKQGVLVERPKTTSTAKKTLDNIRKTTEGPKYLDVRQDDAPKVKVSKISSSKTGDEKLSMELTKVGEIEDHFRNLNSIEESMRRLNLMLGSDKKENKYERKQKSLVPSVVSLEEDKSEDEEDEYNELFHKEEMFVPKYGSVEIRKTKPKTRQELEEEEEMNTESYNGVQKAEEFDFDKINKELQNDLVRLQKYCGEESEESEIIEPKRSERKEERTCFPEKTSNKFLIEELPIEPKFARPKKEEIKDSEFIRLKQLMDKTRANVELLNSKFDL